MNRASTMQEKPTYRLSNWRAHGEGKRVQYSGYVYDNPKFNYGDYILTSHVLKEERDEGKPFKIVTRNSQYMLVGGERDPDA